jgi:hypothetical protein
MFAMSSSDVRSEASLVWKGRLSGEKPLPCSQADRPSLQDIQTEGVDEKSFTASLYLIVFERT